MSELCRDAGDHGVNLLLFPELTVTGFVLGDDVYGAAEQIPGPSSDALCTMAGKYNLYICAGMVERHHGLNYNAMVLAGPDGIVGKYRKVHLPFVEYPSYTAGGKFNVFELFGWKVGIATCCDNLFSEQFRILAIRGAEIILSPFCWLYESDDSRPLVFKKEPPFKEINGWIKSHMKKLLPARVYENGVYLMAVNQYGPIGTNDYYASGGVVMFGPDGDLIAENTRGPYKDEIITAVFTRMDLDAWRARGNFSLKLRRPELYGAIRKSR